VISKLNTLSERSSSPEQHTKQDLRKFAAEREVGGGEHPLTELWLPSREGESRRWRIEREEGTGEEVDKHLSSFFLEGRFAAER